MRRRAFLVAVCGAVASPQLAAAAGSTNKKRLAIFVPSELSADWHEHSGKRYSRALFAELRRLGQIEGQNLTVESYGREQNTSGLEALATEIVDSNPDVILLGGPGALIFKKLTSRIPIVTITGDPVRLGIAESLARPGGNFTGASIDAGPSIHGKRIELLREIFLQYQNLACSLFTSNTTGSSRVRLFPQRPRRLAYLSRCRYWMLVLKKMTGGQR